MNNTWLKRGLLLTLVLVLMSFISVTVIGQDEEVRSPLNDTFETEELFSGTDDFNNAIGHATWGATAGNVQLSLAEVERDGEMTNALAINYDIGSWGGFTHALTDGEAWVSQDWTAFGAFQFDLYGNNTGGVIQVEIFDNRNLSLDTDTAERWYFRITDDYEGWQTFTIPFEAFQRRTDFQPGGAPNDGFGLDAVSGYAFGMPAGVGAQEAFLDNVMVVTLEVEPLVVDAFEEDELFQAQDSVGNGIGYVAWGDTPGNVELRLIDAIRGSDETGALVVDYDIAGFGGFSHVFNDGEEWVGQDWTGYNAISFWYLGSNSGEEIQFEIFDNRNPDMDGDSAERWFYRFEDNTFNWQQIEIPFVEFQRRSDWQPEGAPDDGFSLNDVSGYAFGMPVGSGVAIIDDIRLISMAGVEMPEGVVITETAPAEPTGLGLPEVEPNPELLDPIPFAEPILVADHENGLPYTLLGNAGGGFFTWGDATGNAIIGATRITPTSQYALPEQEGINNAMRIDYNVGAWGGFDHVFVEDGERAPQDWTNHNAFQFWLYGNNTGGIYQLDLFDNDDPNSDGDTAERFRYEFVDDWDGWQQVTIPFAFFYRRTDWQPGGAPNDGFGLNEMNGYALGFPAGVGAHTSYLDNVQVVVVEDPTQVVKGSSND